MVMPGGVTGLMPALDLRETKHSLKVIISSGYDPSTVKPEEFEGQGTIYHAKPYEGSTLTIS
jgi:hypothetical protein